MLGIQLQKTKIYQEARTEEAADNALMLLDQKLGILDDSIVASINELNLDQLRFLIRGVINFETTADLQKFLDSLS